MSRVLRISNWVESRLGRNDGNPLYVTACLKRMQYYGNLIAGLPEDTSLLSWFADPAKKDPLAEAAAKEFYEKYGERIEIDHLYPTGDMSPFGEYGLNLHVDWGEDGLTEILPYKPLFPPHPVAAWISDTHINNGELGDSYPYRLSVAKKSDFVFVAQKAAVEKMKADGIENPIWLPHAFEPQAYFKTEMAEKKYDVCFIGNVNNQKRADHLDRLFREFPNFDYGQALFEEAGKRFCNSKIVFNIAMTDDINMRCFEAMGTGSFLLTNWIPTIEEFFEDGKHLVLYRSEDEMIEKAKYYLAHDEEREKIAQAGYEEVMAKHTIQHRVSKMLDVCVPQLKVKELVSVL